MKRLGSFFVLVFNKHFTGELYYMRQMMGAAVRVIFMSSETTMRFRM